jgi:uncharacterized ParB-like nuclease family protein
MKMPHDPRELPSELKKIPLDKVQLDRRTQMRVRTDFNLVAEYVEVLRAKKDFKEPVEVYFDGKVYWIGDGFHRVEAYHRAGRDKITALVREGSWQDAKVHAMGANGDAGLRRNRKDVRKVIAEAFEMFPKLSDRAIAQICRTTHPTVAAHRPANLKTDTRTYTDKHGNESVMDVSRLRGKTAASAPAPVNAFHDLPVATKTVLKELLRVISGHNKSEYSFVLTWLKGSLPDKPKAAEQLLTELEIEEGAGEEMKF